MHDHGCVAGVSREGLHVITAGCLDYIAAVGCRRMATSLAAEGRSLQVGDPVAGPTPYCMCTHGGMAMVSAKTRSTPQTKEQDLEPNTPSLILDLLRLQVCP